MQAAASKPTSIIVTENKNGTSDKIEGLIKGRINSLVFMDDRASILAKYFFSKEFLGSNDNYFRKRQRLAIKALIRNLNSGLSGGLIKLPTGLGKTFLFGNVIKALNKPSIILVPRENLVDGTYDELVGSEKKAGIGFEARKVSRIYGKGKGDVVNQARELLSNGEFEDTLIITYQSFVSLLKRDESLFNELMKNIGCIVSDEAHRSLGEQTKKAIESVTGDIDDKTEQDNTVKIQNEDVEEQISIEDEEQAEQKIDELLKRKGGLVHIKTTATKRLSNKEVGGETLYEATLGDAVNDGDLVLPRQSKLGIAHTEIDGKKVAANDNNKSLDKYLFDDGIPVYEELTLEYMLEKDKNGGYLPTVAFCNTTDQVEFYVNYLLQNGIRAIQCTTNTKGTNYKDINEAENLLESGKADIIVTCSKVGEGWDLPTLRGSMWLVPSSSPARIMQGNGRITRILKDEDVKRISKLTGIPKEYIIKTTNNTIIFSPSKWIYNGSSGGDNNGGSSGGLALGDNIEGFKVSELFTGMELYGQYGELTIEQLSSIGIDFDVKDIKFKEKYTLEELKVLNIPEDVLGENKKWKPYAERINTEKPNKILPISLDGLASLLGCKGNKEGIMKALGQYIKEKYTLEELKVLNIPEDVLGDKKEWKPYAERINIENPSKVLPKTLEGLANLLGCERKKEEIMKALEMDTKELYTLEELRALNIPEDVLGDKREWKPYAERINIENPNKVLPKTLSGLASLLGCNPRKEEMMKALGMDTKESYTLEELRALKIPEDVLGDRKEWKPYAERINTENPNKVLPISLEGLANLLGCKKRKEEIMKALGMYTKNQYTLEELKALNIPEDVLGGRKWKPYAEKINSETLDKVLPTSLKGLASLLGCKIRNEEIMKALEITSKQYSIEELKTLDIPEDVLGIQEKWRLYAERINTENPNKILPISLGGLTTILGCKKGKEEIMKALEITSKQYFMEELKALNIPEDVLENNKWKLYAERINTENPNKVLPISLDGLASLLGCERKKEEIMKALEITSKQYSIEELKALNIPEDILGSETKWKSYAERINIENPSKVLPKTLDGLASLLGCKKRKEEIMKALGMDTKKQYTIEEVKALNIPEDVLGDKREWKPYAERINIENPNKVLPKTLSGLASLLGCNPRKEEIMKALGMDTKESYTLEELKALNVNERILGQNMKWKKYAEVINLENPNKALPTTLGGLASLLGCNPRKEEIMKALGLR